MATLNEYTSVLAVILSGINHSDTNFIYILSANKRQQQIRKNDRKNTLKQTKQQMKSQFVYKHTAALTLQPTCTSVLLLCKRYKTGTKKNGYLFMRMKRRTEVKIHRAVWDLEFFLCILLI